LTVDELANPWFRPEAVARLIEDHRAKRADHSFKVMALVALALWNRNQVQNPLEAAR